MILILGAVIGFVVISGALYVLATILGGQMQREFDERSSVRMTWPSAGCDDELVREQLRSLGRVFE